MLPIRPTSFGYLPCYLLIQAHILAHFSGIVSGSLYDSLWLLAVFIGNLSSAGRPAVLQRAGQRFSNTHSSCGRRRAHPSDSSIGSS